MKLTFTKLLKIVPDGIFKADNIVTKDGRKGVRYNALSATRRASNTFVGKVFEH